MSDSIKGRGIPAALARGGQLGLCFQDCPCLPGLVLPTAAIPSGCAGTQLAQE